LNLEEVDILYTVEELRDKVKELGNRISADYEGESLLVVGILKGAFVFMADLIREIDIPMELDFMSVSSYGKSSETSGEVRILKDLEFSIEGKHVLVIEDIVDTGLTLDYITRILKERGCKSVKICCLLDKPSRRRSPVIPDYIGYTIPDSFVVGYGLDYAGCYRNYPAVCILKPIVYEND